MTPSARAQWRRTHQVPEPVLTIADFLPPSIVERDEAAELLGFDAPFPPVPEPTDNVWSEAMPQGW